LVDQLRCFVELIKLALIQLMRHPLLTGLYVKSKVCRTIIGGWNGSQKNKLVPLAVDIASYVD
ncbi:MAG: hypothetical protein P8N63_03600, partial [Pseudomonadales bacterium]|nr:hypothetical protein [Pseudomonadales bacterium]